MLQCKKILITKAVHFWLTSVAQKRRVLKLPKVSVPSVSANPAHWSKFALIKIRSRHASIEVFLVGQLEQTREWGKKKNEGKKMTLSYHIAFVAQKWWITRDAFA